MKRIIAAYYDELFNQGRIELVDELLHPEYVNHSPAPGLRTDREGVKVIVAQMREAFPGLRYTIEDMVVGPDAVAVRTSVRADGFSAKQITIEHFKDGRIIAHHRVTEALVVR